MKLDLYFLDCRLYLAGASNKRSAQKTEAFLLWITSFLDIQWVGGTQVLEEEPEKPVILPYDIIAKAYSYLC